MMSGAFIQLFREHLEAKKYIIPEKTFLLAVSGGSDSMALADLFLKNNLPIAVAHCNFGLRAQESDLDEQLVKDWCALHNIRFHATKFDTKKSAQEWKKGTQETARMLRYTWFEQIRVENKYSKIVTAHHANDNMETLLINLFKGTGIGGLHGILPEHGHIIRPLLFATREMLAEYVAEHNINYREDASNATDDYLRNAVRHNIIPAVEQWFPNAVGQVSKSIERFGEAEILYKKAVEQERKKLVEQRGQDYYIPILKLKHRQPLATILYEILEPFGFSPGQAPHVIRLMDSESGHYIDSHTHRLIRNRDFLIITGLPSPSADFILIESASAKVETGKYIFSFSIQDKPKTIPTEKNEAYIDLDEVTFPLILRKWRNGDYLYPLGMKMKMKKVSRLLIDEKVPIHEKEHIRIIECNKRIIWVSGIRLDERFKIKASTTKVLAIKVTANC